MNKEKQIEEMANDLENHTCMSQFQAETTARMLHHIGYRKASEIAREIFAEIMSAIEQGKSNADARMKDLAPYTHKTMTAVGKVYSGEIGKAISEVFKNKYTEEEKDDG